MKAKYENWEIEGTVDEIIEVMKKNKSSPLEQLLLQPQLHISPITIEPIMKDHKEIIKRIHRDKLYNNRTKRPYQKRNIKYWTTVESNKPITSPTSETTHKIKFANWSRYAKTYLELPEPRPSIPKYIQSLFNYTNSRMQKKMQNAIWWQKYSNKIIVPTDQKVFPSDKPFSIESVKPIDEHPRT